MNAIDSTRPWYFRLALVLSCLAVTAQCLAWLLPVGRAVAAALDAGVVVCAVTLSVLLARRARSEAASASTSGETAGTADPRQAAWLVDIAARTTNAIAITDARRHVMWINPAFEQLFGYRLDDLRGGSLRKLIAGRPADLPALRRVVAAMEQGRSSTAEIVYRRRDAREVITRIEATPLRDSAGQITGYMIVHEDLSAQRQVERALHASETRFRLLTEAAPIMVWIEDEHGVCDWFNQQWVNFVGREMALDRDEGWLDHVHPEDREACRQRSRESSAARGPFEARYRLLHKDGEYRHVFDRGVPRWDEAGTFLGYVGAVVDVTLIEDQQREIAEMRNYLGDALESIDGGVILLDPEDRLVMCNRRYREMFDLPDSLVQPGMSYRDQLLTYYRAHPEDCEGLAPETFLAQRMQHHRRDAVWEERFGERWVQVRERPTRSGGLVGLRVDVTDVKRTEAALRERQEFLELAVHATNDGLFEWNLETGELYFSPRFHELLGYQPGQLPTRLEAWVDYLYAADRPAIFKVMRRAARVDHGATSVEHRCRMADGSYRWFCARGMAVHGEDGRPRRMVGSVSDIHERKLRELELVQARQLLQDAIDTVDGGLVMFDASDHLVFANRRYREIYGFGERDIEPGVHILDITRAYYTRHPDHLNGMLLEEMVEQRRSKHRGASSAWEMQLGERWFQVNDRTLADGSVISLRTDVTALKRATAAFEERRELLEIVVRASNDGLWDWHAQTGALYISPRLKELLGYGDNEIGSDWVQWHALIHPDDKPTFDAAIRRVVNDAGSFELEYRMRHRGGDWHWFHSRAMAIRDPGVGARRVAGSTSDITAQKRRECELSEARQQLHEAIEAMDAGIVRFDADDHLLFCNERYRTMYGLPAKLTRPGTPFNDILSDYFRRHPEDRGGNSVAGSVQRRLAQHRRRARVWEQQLSNRWVLVSDRPTADGGCVSLRTDITNFKRIEADLSLAKANAEAANVAKSQFLANVSHELRTPLNGIIGMLQVLDDPAFGPTHAEHVDLALRSGRALLELINDLLDGSKIEAGKLTLEQVGFKLADVIADARATLAATADARHISVRCEIAPGCPPHVIGDPTRLRQILTNLLSNAIKFTNEGEVVVEVAPGAAVGYVHFAIRDSGIGIPPHLQASIFEPFTQAEESTSRRFGGTGLGLSICRSLARLMGGELSVVSQVGQGSCFAFDAHLPAAEPGASSEAGAATPVHTPDAVAVTPAGRPQTRVLVVDDVDVNLRVVVALLRRLAVEVDTAANGREALSRIAARDYDLVFMDCQMPEMDGYQTTRAMRDQLGQACPPIVAMTANVGTEDRCRAAAAGMSDFLTKPVDGRALEAVLRQCTGSPAALLQDAGTPLQQDRLAALSASLGPCEFADLLEVFERTVEAHLDSVHECVQREDYATAARLAHAIRGVSANLGAGRLAELADRLERRCVTRDLPALTEVAELRAELAEVTAAVAARVVAA